MHAIAWGDIDGAVEWASKTLRAAGPLFDMVTRPPIESRLRQSAGWPALLKKMNLTEAS